MDDSASVTRITKLGRDYLGSFRDKVLVTNNFTENLGLYLLWYIGVSKQIASTILLNKLAPYNQDIRRIYKRLLSAFYEEGYIELNGLE